MPANESITIPNPETADKPSQVASWGHLVGYLAILAGVVAWGIYTQHTGIGKAGTAQTGQLANHSQAIRIYLIAIVSDFALLYYCWAGVRHYGGNLATLTGGRWTSWKAVAIDIAIAFPFWVVWEATAYGVARLLGPGTAKSFGALLPQTLFEISLWIIVSITAGFCEEIQSRGYLQQQLHGLSGSIVIAVLAQGVIFGLMHSYQGWRQMVIIAVLGVLYGALAAWRKNLRANMIAHAWSDIWEGWLKYVVWR